MVLSRDSASSAANSPAKLAGSRDTRRTVNTSSPARTQTNGQTDPIVTDTVEPAVLVPKSQLDLLTSQIENLATTIVEKQQQQQQAVTNPKTNPANRRQNTGSPSRGPNSSSSNNNNRTRSSSFNPNSNSSGYNNRYNNNRNDSSHSNNHHHHQNHYNNHQNHYNSNNNKHTLLPKQDIEDLMKSLPKYSGHVSESFSWWSSQIDSFIKTFNIRNSDIEYFIPRLLSSRALDLYKSIQRANQQEQQEKNNTSDGEQQQLGLQRKRYYPVLWNTVKRELYKLDNPVARTLYLHNRMSLLRPTLIDQLEKNRLASSCYPATSSSATSSTSSSSNSSDQPNFTIDGAAIELIITHFRLIETQMESPTPLAERLVLLFQVLPECKPFVLEKINTVYEETATMPFNTIDEVCDFVLICKDEVVKKHLQQTYSNKNNFNNPRHHHNHHHHNNSAFPKIKKGSSTWNNENDPDSDPGFAFKSRKYVPANGNYNDYNADSDTSHYRNRQTRVYSNPKMGSISDYGAADSDSGTMAHNKLCRSSTKGNGGGNATGGSPAEESGPGTGPAGAPSNVPHLALSSCSEDDGVGPDADADPGLGSASAGGVPAICNYCGRAGHKANKCFKRKRVRQREKSKQGDGEADGEGEGDGEGDGDRDVDGDVFGDVDGDSDVCVSGFGGSEETGFSSIPSQTPNGGSVNDTLHKLRSRPRDDSCTSSAASTPLHGSPSLVPN